MMFLLTKTKRMSAEPLRGIHANITNKPIFGKVWKG